MRSVQKVSSHVLWKMETFIEEDTRYKKHCAQNNDTSVLFKVGILGPHTVFPIAISCPIIFSWISSMVWNIFPFKRDFSFGKSQKSQGATSGLQGALSHLIDRMFAPKNSARDVIHEQGCCPDETANHQLPIAAAFWIIPIVSIEKYSSLTQHLMQIKY